MAGEHSEEGSTSSRAPAELDETVAVTSRGDATEPGDSADAGEAEAPYRTAELDNEGSESIDDDRNAPSESPPGTGFRGYVPPGQTAERFGWRDWLLVVVVVLSFVVAPLVVIWRPPALPYWFAMLLLPMAPGIVLGVLAVWVALAD